MRHQSEESSRSSPHVGRPPLRRLSEGYHPSGIGGLLSPPQRPKSPSTPQYGSPGSSGDDAPSPCVCNRTPRNIVCRACGHAFQGRVRSACPKHPNIIHLMDTECCPNCWAAQLKEFSEEQRWMWLYSRVCTSIGLFDFLFFPLLFLLIIIIIIIIITIITISSIIVIFITSITTITSAIIILIFTIIVISKVKDWIFDYTDELGYDRLNWTRKIGPLYTKSVTYSYTYDILDMHVTGTKHIVRHRRKSVVQWSVISKFACTTNMTIYVFNNLFIHSIQITYSKNLWNANEFGWPCGSCPDDDQIVLKMFKTFKTIPHYGWPSTIVYFGRISAQVYGIQICH